MSVPETPMHKNDCPVSWKNNVWLSFQLFYMKPESKPATVK